METKPSSFDDFFSPPFDPQDVTSPITRTPDKIMLNSFIIFNILKVRKGCLKRYF
jgi:hypothetical protein